MPRVTPLLMVAGLTMAATLPAAAQDMVYVESLGTYFYASAMDEEDAYAQQGEWWLPHQGVVVLEPADEQSTILRGTVSSVGDEEFTIDRGARQVTVQVEGLDDNPLDDEGYQRIEPGDYVTVRGEIDYDLFEGRELEATSVITLWDSNRDGANMRTNLSADSIQGTPTQPDTGQANPQRSGDTQPGSPR